ncbi:MAG: type II toxin-antitoxin system RelE/ParE family toxin [Anaerolineales bacterium]|nr:type II toxin-antitoxin system RelE/ParE family toxin [Anaerolineales bacterium]
MVFKVEIGPDAWEHLQAFPAHAQALLLDTIEQQLCYQPDNETRNRKPLRPNTLASWELRVGDFRIFYDIISYEATVFVVAMGIKKHNRLTIGGKEFKL